MSDGPALHVAGDGDRPRLREPWWGRQPGETAKAFLAFRTYRDQRRDRSLAKTCEALGRPRGYVGQVERWSSAHRWRVRVEAFDAHEDEIRRAAAARQVEEMAERHVTESLEMQRVAVMPAREIIRRLDSGELDLSTLDALRLFSIARLATYGYTAAARMERMARGVEGAELDAEAAALAEERERIAELQGEAVVQVIVLVLADPEIGLPADRQEVARRLAGRHLRELASGELGA